MAYNKDNYKYQNLTPKQEKFVDGILQGKTQYQSYIDAYPRAKKWKRNSVDSLASQLMTNTKIAQRLQELGWKDKTEVQITRKNMLKRVDKLMTEHEKEMERIKNAYEQDKALVMKQLSEWMSLLNMEGIDRQGVQAKINELTKQLIDLDKVRRLNAVNTHGINECAKIINRMMGYDITKVEISNTDEEREEMEKLSAEELKELINISKKGE